jgi:hypothetical protein
MSFIFDEAFKRLTRQDLTGSGLKLQTAISENRFYIILVTSAPASSVTNMNSLSEIGDKTKHVVLAGGSLVEGASESYVTFNNPTFTSLTTATSQTAIGAVIGYFVGGGVNRTADIPVIYSPLSAPYVTQTTGSPTLTLTLPSTGVIKMRKV